MTHSQDSDRVWARFLLLAVTAVCLFGAWLTPYRLPLPRDYRFFVQEWDADAERVVKAVSVESGTQLSEFLNMLRKTDLRQAVFPLEHTSPNDAVYLCHVRPLSGDDLRDMPDACKILLWKRQDRCLGTVDVSGGRYYRILDPEPLLAFLENEISFA